MSRRALILLSLLAVALVISGCTGASSGVDPSANLAASPEPNAIAAAVLVPDDERFQSQWMFLVDPSPNNYKTQAHWDPSFNDDIDRSLMVESYQINSTAGWTADPPGDDAGTRAALVQVLIDSRTAGGACEPADAEAPILLCRYEDGNGAPLTVLVRRFSFSGDESIMLVLGDSAAGLDYISGSFSPIARTEASRWFDG